MTGLVSDLRAFASDYCTTTHHDDLVRNAADEIERLRLRDLESQHVVKTLEQANDYLHRETEKLRATLKEVKRYLEEVEVLIDQERGNGRVLAQLIKDGGMPPLYMEVLRRLEVAP